MKQVRDAVKIITDSINALKQKLAGHAADFKAETAGAANIENLKAIHANMEETLANLNDSYDAIKEITVPPPKPAPPKVLPNGVSINNGSNG